MKPTAITYGENSVLLSWPNRIEEPIHQQVLLYERSIRKQFKASVLETIIGYQSLMICLKDNMLSKDFLNVLDTLILDHENANSTNYVYSIPVCYDTSLGIDLQNLATQKEISIAELIQLHTQTIYRIYCIGFLPGFLYLGGLNEVLDTPRLENPRQKVPKGAVAIGGKQAGIYPMESPGGWHIIGQTPIELFDSSTDPPILFKAGDRIQFLNISIERFEAIRLDPSYVIEREVYYG